MTNTTVKIVNHGLTNQNMNQNTMETAKGAEYRNCAHTVEASNLSIVKRWTTRSMKNDILEKAILEINIVKEFEQEILREILNTLSIASGIPVEKIGKSRKLEIISVKQIYYYLGKKTRIPLTQIGSITNQDHSSVSCGNKVIVNILNNNHKDKKTVYVKEILNRYDKIVSGNIN